jgi:hypothetical protein
VPPVPQLVLVWALRRSASRELLLPGPYAGISDAPPVVNASVSADASAAAAAVAATAAAGADGSSSDTAAAAAAAAAVTETTVRYVVISRCGARVRSEIDLESPEVASLPQGTELTAAVGQSLSGTTTRVRLLAPVCGWVSDKPSILRCLGPSGHGAAVDACEIELQGEEAEQLRRARIEDCMEEDVGSEHYRREDR